MIPPAPEPKPKRSRRMVVWLVAVPVVILLLALAGANWKTFHLAYAKHLIASTDSEKQCRGLAMVIDIHVHYGMSLKEVRQVVTPARVNPASWSRGGGTPLRAFTVDLEDSDFYAELGFDDDGKLRFIQTVETVNSLPPEK